MERVAALMAGPAEVPKNQTPQAAQFVLATEIGGLAR
jgi:hypothetical protein